MRQDKLLRVIEWESCKGISRHEVKDCVCNGKWKKRGRAWSHHFFDSQLHNLKTAWNGPGNSFFYMIYNENDLSSNSWDQHCFPQDEMILTYWRQPCTSQSSLSLKLFIVLCTGDRESYIKDVERETEIDEMWQAVQIKETTTKALSKQRSAFQRRRQGQVM